MKRRLGEDSGLVTASVLNFIAAIDAVASNDKQIALGVSSLAIMAF